MWSICDGRHGEKIEFGDGAAGWNSTTFQKLVFKGNSGGKKYKSKSSFSYTFIKLHILKFKISSITSSKKGCFSIRLLCGLLGIPGVNNLSQSQTPGFVFLCPSAHFACIELLVCICIQAFAYGMRVLSKSKLIKVPKEAVSTWSGSRRTLQMRCCDGGWRGGHSSDQAAFAQNLCALEWMALALHIYYLWGAFTGH